MSYSDIIVERQNQVGILTLNSPKTINALSKNMIQEITQAFTDFKSDRNIKVLIIKANGKHFCSGHNLKEMVSSEKYEYKNIFENCTRMMLLIHEIPQIVIAQVHGIATAAGCQMVATCDLAIADETAQFGTPGVRIGLFCSTPMIALSRCIGKKRALEMLMSGKLINAEQAEKYGLINRIVSETELDSTVLEIAHNIAEASPMVLALGKKTFYEQVELDEPRAYAHAVDVMTLNLMSDDAQEGIAAFIEKRKPVWTGK